MHSIILILFYYSNFDNVVRLSVLRARAIPRAHRVLFWHHCFLSLYQYLAFRTL